MSQINKEEFDHYIKLLVIGDQSVGKSSFIRRFLEDKFSEEPINSKELELKKKMLEIDNQKIFFHVWDGLINAKLNKTTNSELSIRIQGIIIMYDVSCYTSFNSLDFYIKEVKEKCGSDMPILIITNNLDLDDRIISENEGEKFAEDNNVEYIEISVQNNININESIIKINKKIMTNSYYRGDTVTLNNEKKFSKKKKKKFC